MRSKPAGAVIRMKTSHLLRAGMLLGVTITLTACGGISSGNLFGGKSDSENPMYSDPTQQSNLKGNQNQDWERQQKQSTIWDLFSNQDDPNVTIEVNKYLWQASLEVLDFLPIQSVDPFSGLIITGYGTPPGGGRAYKATIHISDPALDARSLKVALESRGGAVPADTVRAVEDAILTRARQLRIRDANL